MRDRLIWGLVVAFLLPACGGGGGSPPPAPSTIFAPNFLAPEVRLDGGVAGAAGSGNPRICCEGPRLYVVWTDGRNGSNDIYFRRSVDEGATWEPEVRLDTDVAGAAHSYAPRIVCQGARVHVVWQDLRNGSADVYYRGSSDYGVTWTPAEIRLDTDAAGSATSEAYDLAADGTLVCVAWSDTRNGSTDIYFRRSTDGGATWSVSDVRLDTGTAAGASESGAPRIHVSGLRVLCTWEDRRNPRHDIFTKRSTDGGNTWPDPEVQMDTDGLGTAFSRFPKVVASGNNIAVLWQDDRSLMLDAYMRRSTDGGATWLPSDQRLDSDVAGAAGSDYPQGWWEGDLLVVLWADSRNLYYKPYARRSPDNGATWPAPEVRLDAAAGGQHAINLQITGSGQNVYALWSEARTGPVFDIFFDYSTDGGQTWQAGDLRLDTDAAGAADSWEPQICCNGTKVFIVWGDDRNGMRDIYFRRSVP
jgi:Neuraminidase (sialidase)